MRIKRFLAPDMRTALKQVRDEHGPDAVILSNRPVPGGIEIVAATDYDEALVQQALRTAAPGLEPIATPPAPIAVSRAPVQAAATPAPAPNWTPPAVRESRPASRADEMIAALAGAPAPLREKLVNRARNALRGRSAPAPDAQGDDTAVVATAPELVAPTPSAPAAVEPVAPPPAKDAPAQGEDFRALLARLNDSEAAATVSLANAVAAQRAATANERTAPTRSDSEVAQRMADVIRLDRQTHVAEAVPPAHTVPAADAVASELPAAEVASAASPPLATTAGQPSQDPARHATAASSEPAPTASDEAVAEAPQAPAQEPETDSPPAVAQAPAPEAPALHLISRPSEDPMIRAMREELAGMRVLMEKQLGLLAVERLRGHPARAAAYDALRGYGCDDALAQQIASRLDPRLTPQQIRVPMQAELMRALPVCAAEPIDQGGVIALVGPTGAGKTTTAAKLAARYAAKHRARDVALVTADSERAGAREQLHAHGRRLGVTVCEVSGPEMLNETLDQLADYPLVLVDTAGYATRDRALLSQILWLRGGGARPVRSLLVLPANANPHDLSEIVRRYRPASPEAVVLTKTDETGQLGAALSVVIKQDLPLAYTTFGQEVPADLEVADASGLVLALEKLRRAADTPFATEDRHVV